MNFDVKDFLERQNIFYRERGPGVKKGNIIIHCPYCGSEDVGEHLGISLSNGVWGCWRNDSHRNRDLAILLTKLIGISYNQARELIGKKYKEVNLDLFDELSSDNYFKKKERKNSLIKTLLLLKDFREFKGSFSIPYRNYLHNRNFDRIWKLVDIYQLRYAITGDYKCRLIFPVYFNNQLVTWTSRAIYNSKLRYKTLSDEKSSINIKNTIYNYDRANKGGKVLFIVEGPIDTIKMDFYLDGLDGFAVGLFNMSISDNQLYYLINLFDKFETVVLLLDNGELENTNKGISKLNSTGIKINEGILPKNIKDPGELNKYQVKNLYKKWR